MGSRMKLALVLSYDYPELSEAEALSCLRAEGVKPFSWERKERILTVELEAEREEILRACTRSAVIKEAFEVVSESEGGIWSLDPLDILPYLRGYSSFSVRCSFYPPGSAPKGGRRKAESWLGSEILRMTGMRVNLRSLVVPPGSIPREEAISSTRVREPRM